MSDTWFKTMHQGIDATGRIITLNLGMQLGDAMGGREWMGWRGQSPKDIDTTGKLISVGL